jgi:hypothetical protein
MSFSNLLERVCIVVSISPVLNVASNKRDPSVPVLKGGICREQVIYWERGCDRQKIQVTTEFNGGKQLGHPHRPFLVHCCNDLLAGYWSDVRKRSSSSKVSIQF